MCANKLTIPATNIATAFYTATFPSLVHNLPRVLKSEQDVKDGVKTYVFLFFVHLQAQLLSNNSSNSAEEHAELDSYERSKVC